MAFKIALSAGHGRNTAGKRCMKALDPNETREWVLNDRICDKIERKLKEYTGYELLRLDDTTGNIDVALKKRTGKANRFHADFYLSIHHNAGINGGSGGGVVAFTYLTVDKVTQVWQKALYDAVIKHTGLKGNRSTPLAKQNFHECRESAMPAVLLECGFMDSKVDVPIILTEQFAEQVSDACVEVLAERGGLQRKEKPKPQPPKTEHVQSGDVVKIMPGAVYYNTNTKVPSWVVGKNWLVKSVNGSRAIIDKSADGKNAINSPVDVKYLKAVSASKPPEQERIYIVQKGDSFWKIAAEQLGNGARCSELAAYNGMKTSDTIFAGMKLKLPRK